MLPLSRTCGDGIPYPWLEKTGGLLRELKLLASLAKLAVHLRIKRIYVDAVNG